VGLLMKGQTIYFNTNIVPSSFGPQTTSLIIGNLSPALQTELNNPVAFGGRIGEIRVWNTFMTEAQLNVSQFTSLNGNEAGLVHRWKFDEGITNSQTIIDTVGASNGNLAGPVYVPRAGSNLNMIQNDMIPFYQFSRQIAANGTASISLSCNQYLFASQTLLFSRLPTSGILSNFFTQQPVQNAMISANTSQSINRYRVQYTPDRTSCGTVTQVAGYSTVAAFLTNSFSAQITVRNLTGGALLPTTSPTTGGVISILGNVGANGVLLANENCSIQFPTKTFPCTAASVTGGILSCTIPAGVGANAAVVVNLCGTTITGSFSYSPPTISTVLIVNNYITINGQNFGPPRVFDNLSDRVTISNTTTIFLCSVTSVNQQLLMCNVSTILSHGTYVGEVTIGGQNVMQNVAYGVPVGESRVVSPIMGLLLILLYTQTVE